MQASDVCCSCYNPNVNDLIYSIRFTIDRLSQESVKSKLYGYSCDKKSEDKLDKLESYLRILEDYNRKTSWGGEPCLDCYKLQTLAEKVRIAADTCDVTRKDLVVDKSGVDAWIAQHPGIVSRERWEKLAYTIWKTFNLQLIPVEEICDITFQITRNLIPCDVIMALAVVKQNCDLDLRITRNEDECEADFNILVSEVECDLDLRTYRELIDCNISFDAIKAVYENGCSFEIS